VGAVEELQARWEAVQAEAHALAVANKGDDWAGLKRRLMALAEALALLPDGPGMALALLRQAMYLPHGFAGYRAPACLTLVEANRICFPGDQQAVNAALRDALNAAHNIQDSTHCARITARCKAMSARRWGVTRAGFGVEAVIAQLLEDSSTKAFTALHVVGERYEHRAGPDRSTPLPEQYLQADTLEELAKVYQRPLDESQRLNPKLGRAATDPLSSGTQVNVPDPGFATWLAGLPPRLWLIPRSPRRGAWP
jgi:hypothetical protein